MTPDWQILADGVDVSANFNDRLIELSVTDAEGMKSDKCEITVDDRDGQIEVPRKGAILSISMGYKETGLTFMGLFTVDEVELSGLPYKMRISASAADLRDKLKSQRNKGYENKKIGDIVGDVAKRHGLTPAVGASVKDFNYKYLGQTEESDLHMLTRLATKHDALFSIKNGKLLFMRRGEAMSASGQSLAAVTIQKWEVISFTATFQDRPAHKKSKATWWDSEEVDRKEEDSDEAEE